MNLIIPPRITALFTPLELAIHKARFIRRLEIIGALQQEKSPDSTPGKTNFDEREHTATSP